MTDIDDQNILAHSHSTTPFSPRLPIILDFGTELENKLKPVGSAVEPIGSGHTLFPMKNPPDKCGPCWGRLGST